MIHFKSLWFKIFAMGRIRRVSEKWKEADVWDVISIHSSGCCSLWVFGRWSEYLFPFSNGQTFRLRSSQGLLNRLRVEVHASVFRVHEELVAWHDTKVEHQHRTICGMALKMWAFSSCNCFTLFRSRHLSLQSKQNCQGLGWINSLLIF